VPFVAVLPIFTSEPTLFPISLPKACYWLSYINSTINPLLYFAANQEFRNAFKSLVSL
ncbi:hypothetical protein CAPTEDRAFT_40576, partial [Capitella teleta]